MNAAEHIVESYFRLCRKCFTISDQKVYQGNNRQLDILAYDVKNCHAFHIEVATTHRESWFPTLEKLKVEFDKKFFGLPPERKGRSDGTTDFEKGKLYFESINETYRSLGLDSEKVQRVWVSWTVKDKEQKFDVEHRVNHLKRTFRVQVLSLRDVILPALENAIGTSNYDDEVLRILSLLKEREIQLAKEKRKHPVKDKRNRRRQTKKPPGRPGGFVVSSVEGRA